jgi:hypothetical protein
VVFAFDIEEGGCRILTAQPVEPAQTRKRQSKQNESNERNR